MDPTIDSSPLKRFCTFWLGLATFAMFGVLGLIAYKATGGNSDPAYAARADERSVILEASVKAQAEKLAATPIDLAAAAGLLAEKKVSASAKPAPGTKAFDEWMAAQTAAATATTDAGSANAVKLTLEALPGGVMKFKQTELTVAAGAEVVLTFINPDVMQHNVLLLKPGTIDEVGALADAMAADPKGMEKGFIPVSDNILANSKLVNPAGSDVVRFNAPSEPGDYPYICTFPGHWRLMQGVLKVTEAAAKSVGADGGPDGGSPVTGGAATPLKLDTVPGGVMKFKQTELTVKAGASVELTIVNPDIMQHNFLLLKPGTKEKVGALADAMLTDPDAMKKQYVPESDDILAASKLINPAGIEVLKFTAPAEPGDYPYICTFPGHWRLMFGTLKVTP